ncbi:MAG TPA: PTS sugar transporter subunit IIA [Phycisphaerae bacterium]|nr:PTS sugar transporter subunit IIA [Phycisphaerae bacterium]
MSQVRDPGILVVISDSANGPQLVQCAELLLGKRDGFIHVVRSAARHSFNNIGAFSRNAPYLRYAAREHIFHYPPRKDVVQFANGLARTARLGTLVTDWIDPVEEFQPILKMAVDMGLSAVFLRSGTQIHVRRMLIPMHGGPHTLQQLWVAKELASSMGASTLALRIVTPADQGGNDIEPGYIDAAGELARLESRIIGMNGPVALSAADDVVSGIAARRTAEDMLVIGAPNYWRAAEHFESSTPYLIAQRFPNPLAMLLARRPTRVQLRDVFWEDNVRLRLASSNKNDVITCLLDTLVQHNQIPESARGALLTVAMEREAELSTAVGCDTAFPHIAVEGFPGVIGCLGICPQGMDWGSPIRDGDSETTRFVFLLISSSDYYGDLLAVMAKIARLMVLPGVRKDLLACSSAKAALSILDGNEN